MARGAGTCGGVSGACELGVGRGCPSPDAAPCRCVWVEKESINSVIISDAPEDLHQRMLVAASLSVNATGELGPRSLLACPVCLRPPRPPTPPPVLGRLSHGAEATGLCPVCRALLSALADPSVRNGHVAFPLHRGVGVELWV